MKFRINRDTPTGQVLSALRQRMSECDAASNALVDELGGGPKVALPSRSVAGGIYGIPFKEKPEGWKLVYQHHTGNYYFPKSIPKNRLLLLRIASLPVVKRDEVNAAVGFVGPQFVGNSFINSVGMKFGEDFFLLEIHEEAEFTPTADMIELTVSQYKALSLEIEPKNEVAV